MSEPQQLQPAQKRHKSSNKSNHEIFVLSPRELCGNVFVRAEQLQRLSVEQIAHSRYSCYVLTADKEVISLSNALQNTAVKSLIDEPIVQLAGGNGHFVAVGVSGGVYSWGDGGFGKLGHGDEETVEAPKRIEALEDTRIVQVSCGSGITTFLSSGGEVYTCGRHEEGTGQGTLEGNLLVPHLVEGLKGKHVTQVSADGWHVAVVTDQCDLYTWGFGESGRLGHSGEDDEPTPRLVRALQGKTLQVSCGDDHTAVIAKDGFYTFGRNESGQLGHGDKQNRSEPTAVTTFGNNVQQVSCGHCYTACVSGGSLFIWGSEMCDQLSPKRVESDYVVSHVLVSGCHTIAFVHPSSMGQGDTGSIISTFASMVNDENASDVSFLINNQQIFALKAILVKRCPFFRAMFESGLSESTNHHNIPISNVRKETFLLLLHFLYTDSVDVELEDVIDLYAVADMYQLPQLKNICVASLEKDLSVDNAALMLEKAAVCGHEQLKSACMTFVVRHIAEVSKTEGFNQLQNPGLLREIFASIYSGKKP